SGSGGGYDVEIRALDRFANSCGCIDHRVNGLGTCKHIEGVLAALRRKPRSFRQAATEGNRRIEIFVGREGIAAPAVTFPVATDARIAAAKLWLKSFIGADGRGVSEPERLLKLVAHWPNAPADVRRVVRVSRHFDSWLA